MSDVIKRQYSVVRGLTRYTVDLDIDLDTLAGELVNNAVRNTTGKAALLYGAVTAKVIKKDDAT